MIVLDTNVILEVLKPAPSDRVLQWLAGLEPADVLTTTITQAEILYGIQSLPPGKRQAKLATDRIFSEFEGRILPFDQEAVKAFATVVTVREAAGRPISQFDAMIAAIAYSRSLRLATRNTRDFEGCGVRLVNPWD